MPLTGEEIAKAGLRAAWETTSNVTPVPAASQAVGADPAAGETEQLELLWRQRERQSPVAFKGVPNVQQRQPDDCAVLVVVDRVPIRSLKTRVPPAGARRR